MKNLPLFIWKIHFMDIFRGLADQGKCVIIVTHSPEVAKRADQVYEIKKDNKKK